jgi:flagellar basal-body rod protein FlgB
MDAALGRGDLLMRLLAASNARTQVLANNIANQNTPGYVRQVLRFEELLRAARADGLDLDRVQPELVGDTLTPGRPDGNNVNIELEMNAMRQNRLLYEAYAAILSTRFELLRAGIESGR